MRVPAEALQGQGEPQLPPHNGAALFRVRDTARGYFGLVPVIERELADIKTASEDVFRLRYLYPGTYVRELTQDSASPYDRRDASIVNDKIGDAVITRARELGIDTSRMG